MNQLIPIEKVNIAVFSDHAAMQKLLDRIRTEVTAFVPDASTAKGRKEIGSRGRWVSSSKVVIDKTGKAETDEWARKKKIVDGCRKQARDFCDELRDDILRPRDEYEEKQHKLAAAAALKAEIAAAEIEAHEKNDLIDRETKVAAMEAELEAKRLERERVENEKKAAEAIKVREEKIRLEAEAKATRFAAEAIEAERQKAAQAEQDALEQAKQAERDKEQAIRDAVRAAEAATAAQQAAIEREKRLAQEEADRKERNRLRLIEDEKREAQARAADTENRRKINGAIVKALVSGGVSQTAAKKVVILVATGKVPTMSIRY